MAAAALQYNSFNGQMAVIRQYTEHGRVQRETRTVPIDVLRRIGDSDVDQLIDRALLFPGREHRIQKGIRL